jgi:hypothetical protein
MRLNVDDAAGCPHTPGIEAGYFQARRQACPSLRDGKTAATIDLKER